MQAVRAARCFVMRRLALIDMVVHGCALHRVGLKHLPCLNGRKLWHHCCSALGKQTPRYRCAHRCRNIRTVRTILERGRQLDLTVVSACLGILVLTRTTNRRA